MSEQRQTDETQSHPATAVAALITIIVPTRNEAGNILPLLTRLTEATAELNIEVLFVDDSTDDTVQTITAVQNEFPFAIRCIARPPEQRNGLSGAVVDGIKAANGEWVCVMDADLQHPPQMIPMMWAQAQKTGADMVVGSRKGDVIGPLGLSRGRSLTSKGLTILARMMFPRLLKNVSDPLTGLFLVRKAAVDPAILRPDGFKILLDILVRCPELFVTEVHFDFAPRNDGQSKADIQEGMRFFRHLVRLRVTVNPHLVRFLIVVSLGFLGNSLVMASLTAIAGLNYLLSALMAAELMMLWNFVWFEGWVFSERTSAGLRRRFVADFLLTQLLLFLIQLPVIILLVSRGWTNVLVANLIGVFLVSLLRYSLSEQWIWTKGSMIWQRESYYYDIHGIVGIESAVQLPELQHFVTAVAPDQIDIKIRLDRHGTPSRLPDGVSYDEHLGRFGFGLTVLPGDYSEVVVSPLLERSPNFLFTNIIEPVLRWSLVRRGYALVKAACVADDDGAMLLHSAQDMGPIVLALCTAQNTAFLADDLTIVGRNGRVYSYPKPVTINQQMAQGSSSGRFGLTAQRMLYSPAIRRFGLWLSARNLPAATLNTYIQWLIPQPKYLLSEIVPGVEIVAEAAVATAVFSQSDNKSFSVDKVGNVLQLPTDAYSFQPQPLLVEQLGSWQGRNWQQEEQVIIQEMLRHCSIRIVDDKRENWWLDFSSSMMEQQKTIQSQFLLTQ